MRLEEVGRLREGGRGTLFRSRGRAPPTRKRSQETAQWTEAQGAPGSGRESGLLLRGSEENIPVSQGGLENITEPHARA